MLARQEAVFDTLFWMKQNTDGTYDVSPDDAECYVSLKEGVADLEADIAKFGTMYCYESLHTHSEIYRKSESFRANVKKYGHPIFQGKNATEIWLTTGILVALPSQKACDFRRLNQITASAEAPQYVVLECQCGSIASRTTVTKSIADGYKRLGVEFKCGVCKDKEKPFKPPNKWDKKFGSGIASRKRFVDSRSNLEGVRGEEHSVPLLPVQRRGT